MGTCRIENWPSAPATIAPKPQREFAAHPGDGRVGNELLSETDRVRVWLSDSSLAGASASTPTCSGILGRHEVEVAVAGRRAKSPFENVMDE
jgi:hypothetical protein